MFCTKCGSKMPDGTSFCTKCGSRLSEPAFEQGKLVYDLKGVRGRYMKVYEDRAILSIKANLGSMLIGNVTDEERTIYFKDCSGVEYKGCGMLVGYLKFEMTHGMVNNRSNKYYGENTFTWDLLVQTNSKMLEVANYVRSRIDFYHPTQKTPADPAGVSGPDELKKYKELLDMGAITQEEFDRKKRQILGF